MTSIRIATSEKITTEMLKAFVLSLDGGRWAVHEDYERGEVRNGDHYVRISPDTSLTPYYEPSEIEPLIVALGVAPQSSIQISYSGTKETDAIGAELTRRILMQWHGVIEDDVL